MSTIRDDPAVTLLAMGTIGDRLRQARKEAELTLQEAGDIAGVSRQAIGQIERGVTKQPEASTLEPLCRKYGVSLRWVLTGHGPKKVNGSQPETADNSTRDLVRTTSQTLTPDPAILHEAITLLLFDLDHGGPRTSRSASDLVLALWPRIAAGGGRLPEAEQLEFEEQARARGETHAEPVRSTRATPRRRRS